jgi:NADPH:quinone reductase-like Zn-dependent oxidoreductase
MQALVIRSCSGPDAFLLESAPLPQPAAGEVRVRVRAAALNHRDVFVTQGKYPGVTLPAILGSDGAGEVDGVGDVVIYPMLGWGDDPRAWKPNAQILGMPHQGTFAQYVCVPEENVFAKPAALSMQEAAAIPLAGLTAYRAAFTRGALQAGETVLITGIGGGVQTFVLLFAKHVGARAIVTSGSDEKLARARELGADVTINYRTDKDWHKTARAAGPVDLAVDSTGGEILNKAISALRVGGRAVIYGATLGDATLRPFSIFWNHIDLRGTSMGSPEDFRNMLALFNHGLRPVIDRVYPLAETSAAAERMNDAKQFGKIVIDVP